MSFLLDTNVVSELTRPHPNRGVTTWLDAVEEADVYLSVATIAKLRRGAELLPLGRRRQELDLWLEGAVLARFADRMLPVGVDIANAWGRVSASRRLAGRPIEAIDALLAATALVHGLTLVTRNVRDFADTGIGLLDPWLS